jgi:photoactive yellow protein
MNIFQYQGVDISEVVARLPVAERNALPFGLVKLDKAGIILEYNMAEAEISGVNQEDVVGKNFFLDVAVCTQRPEFYGIFRQAMDGSGFINQIFNYEFQNALYSAVHEPVKVKVHMFSSQDSKGQSIVWLMVKRVDANAKPDIVNVAQSARAPQQAVSAPVQEKQVAMDTNQHGDILIDMD